jgi:predicted anti-sigma-YlaC factor YlaD
VTCDEVRDRLSEHALGTLDASDDARIRRHLRGCAQCRRELAAIGEGLAMFAAAAHDRTPPSELRDRVLGVLAEEWRRDPVVVPERVPGRTRAWLVAAAACIALVGTVSWGTAARTDAASYHRLLSTLGGEEFRVGALDPTGDVRIDGSVVLYDSSVDQSWGVVLVRAPELTGSVGATLSSSDGRTMELHDVELENGSGYTWLVTAEDLHPFDRLTITGPDGSTVASTRIAPA